MTERDRTRRNHYGAEVRAHLSKAGRLNIRGVPKLVIDDGVPVSALHKGMLVSQLVPAYCRRTQQQANGSQLETWKPKHTGCE